MKSSLIITYQVLDLHDPEARSRIQQVLDGNHEHSFYQSDGSQLPNETLLQALNAFTDENEAADLTLEQLEDLSGGVGLPEALVSSTILMAMVAGACGCFADSMGAVQNSQVQDALNAGIHANIEQVRNDLASHDFNALTGTYNPAVASNIGQDFLDKSGYVDDDPNTAGTQTIISIGGKNVIRNITAQDNNSISVEYTYEDTGSTVQSTSMVAPAAGWLS